MKTKELIRLLQLEDPSGDLEVVSDDNSDIHFVEAQPAYWDGCAEVLIRDHDKEGYNIVGAKIVGSGLKVRIHTAPIRCAIFLNPDLPVDLSDVGGSPLDYEGKVENWRSEARDLGPV